MANATTKKGLFSYTHTAAPDPAENEYADTKTIEWTHPGGGTACECQFAIYAIANPGYRFVRWEESGNQLSEDAKFTTKKTHYTQVPNYNTYSYTAVFIAENAVDTELNIPVGKVVLDPAAPQVGDVVKATVETNKIAVGGTPGNPNMMVAFDHWETGDGTVLSRDVDFSFTVEAPMTLRAVYRNLGEQPVKGKYYRIRSAFNRVLSLEGSYKITVTGATDIDNSLMRWVMPLDNDPEVFHTGSNGFEISDNYRPQIVEASPNTVFYVAEGVTSGTKLTKVSISSQGANSKSVTGQTLDIVPMENTLYGYYGINASTLSSAGFKTVVREGQGAIVNISSFSTADVYSALAFQPIDEEHMDMYWFGAAPDASMTFEGGYWTSMYTDYPYECRDGVEAYYIKETTSANGTGYACLTRVEGDKVPAGTGVLLKCSGTESKGNRLLPLDPSADIVPLEGNLLKGVYQLYTSSAKAGRVSFDESTMRVFGVNSRGEVGFYKLAAGGEGGLELAANRAYLDLSSLPASAKAVSFKIGGISGIESVETEDSTVRFEDSVIYDLNGRRVSVPAPGNVYIVNGAKVLWK